VSKVFDFDHDMLAHFVVTKRREGWSVGDCAKAIEYIVHDWPLQRCIRFFGHFTRIYVELGEDEDVGNTVGLIVTKNESAVDIVAGTKVVKNELSGKEAKNEGGVENEVNIKEVKNEWGTKAVKRDTGEKVVKWGEEGEKAVTRSDGKWSSTDLGHLVGRSMRTREYAFMVDLLVKMIIGDGGHKTLLSLIREYVPPFLPSLPLPSSSFSRPILLTSY
jgi:hypothetical protein